MEENVIVQDFSPKKTKTVSSKVIVPVFIFVVIVAGILTGYVLAGRGGTGGSLGTDNPLTSNEAKDVGINDNKKFPDQATGVLEAGGGTDGEGTHKLIREGGPSQTAYLTSSVVDLDQFIGKKVQIWGATLNSRKVSWLMDVGRVKVIE